MELPNVPTELSNLVSEHPIASILGASALGIGVAVGTVAIVKKSRAKSRKKRKSKKSKTRSVRKRGHTRKLKFGSKAFRKKYLGKRRKQKQPHTAGKRKDTSHKRIRFTKHNQPYIILASGKARFIKKSSARVSKKRKGGRY